MVSVILIITKKGDSKGKFKKSYPNKDIVSRPGENDTTTNTNNNSQDEYRKKKKDNEVKCKIAYNISNLNQNHLRNNKNLNPKSESQLKEYTQHNKKDNYHDRNNESKLYDEEKNQQYKCHTSELKHYKKRIQTFP